MKALITVQGVEGKFNVRVVNKGDNYGLRNCLTHDDDEPMVEFYDARYPHTELGQFVSRYNMSTMLKTTPGCGFSLDLGIPGWTVTNEGMNDTRQALKSIQ